MPRTALCQQFDEDFAGRVVTSAFLYRYRYTYIYIYLCIWFRLGFVMVFVLQ